ncbi:MAG: hypothetical protein AAF500_05225 [Myxococcota bacterium]
MSREITPTFQSRKAPLAQVHATVGGTIEHLDYRLPAPPEREEP